MQLQDKVVFLTGGASGIGAACVKGMLEKGAKVIIADNNDVNGKCLTESFKKEYGTGRVMFVKCDVTDDNNFKETFQTAVTAFNQVDIMINNAGVLDEINWGKMLDINLKGTIHGTEIALAHMRKDRGGKGGVILNMASVSGWRPAYFQPVYASSKHGVIGYTKSMAVWDYPRLFRQFVQFRQIPHFSRLNNRVQKIRPHYTACRTKRFHQGQNKIK